MVFRGISRKFSLINEDQYNTIGAFWNEMALIYGLENLQGLGYDWNENEMSYAIGLKNGEIKDANITIELPDQGWQIVIGKTNKLKEIYDSIYQDGALLYEIETFNNNGECQIYYYRNYSI